MNIQPVPHAPPPTAPYPTGTDEPPINDFITLHTETPEAPAKESIAEHRRSAARQAVPFAWKGKQLAPYTPSREAAFHQHRSSINAPEFRDAIADSHSFAADAARMLYFLGHDPAAWLNYLSQQPRGEVNAAGEWEPRNAHAALEGKINEWMDKTWTGSKEERVEAYSLCIDIITRSTATRAVHQEPADPEDAGN